MQEIKAKCPSCKFEFTFKSDDKLEKCPICQYSIQTESLKNSKQILKDVVNPLIKNRIILED